MVGYVSAEDFELMLNDKKEMLEILNEIRQLCIKKKTWTSNTRAPKLPSHEQDAPIESSSRELPLKEEPDNVVKICIKVWLEVSSSILLPNDAYTCISQESLVRIF